MWFFVWGYVKDHVLVFPLPCDLTKLRERITHVVIEHQMLGRVWQKLDYSINVCSNTNGEHMEHLQGMCETWNDSLSTYIT